MNVLAIDQGTSATKALVVSVDGAILSEATREVQPQAGLHPGWIEQDPEELWQSVLESGKAAVAEAGVPIVAVGLANQGETVMRWDPANGRPFGVAVSWQDRRAAGLCEELAEHADELQSITGLPLDPYFSAPKMAWIRLHHGAGGVVTTTDSWLVYRLTGEFVTDAATASRSLLLDLEKVEWSQRACEVFRLDPDRLPAIVDCAGIVGETESFGGRIPVSGLVVDQQAALYAQGCVNAGDAKCTYGTGAFFLMTTGQTAQYSETGLASSVAWQFDNQATFCVDGQVYTVGAAVSWLQRIGLIGSAAELDSLSADVESTNGVTFVPALAGLGAPYWRPNSRAIFSGLTLGTERNHMARSVIEGIAASVTNLAEAAAQDAGRPLTRLRVDGGLTRVTELMQIQADLLQIPLEVYTSPNATALGIARMTHQGLRNGATAGFDTKALEVGRVYEPRISAGEARTRLEEWQLVAELSLSS